MSEPSAAWPRPFFDDGWSAGQQTAARALWQWHLALDQAALQAASDIEWGEEAEHAQEGRPLSLISEDVARSAYEACAAHELPVDLLADQVRGAEQLLGSVRFADGADRKAFVAQWAQPLGRLLCRLAEAKGQWQLRYADQLARGFFLTGRLADLAHDLRRDRLFIPETELDKAGVALEDLQSGAPNERVQKLLWRQTVQARDALAQGQPLVHELPRRPAAALKRWWLGALEWLNEIERRRYDVWSRPIELSAWHRMQVRYQARFGRATFKPR